LDALVFAVHDCGLKARCALEEEDGGQVRLEKIFKIVQSCRFGIHDLSRTTLDTRNRLPRFNMPLELGVFLGVRRWGDRQQRRKSCLILDRDRHRYRIFCSDIAGQDIRDHANDVAQAITAVRTWPQSDRPSGRTLASPSILARQYIDFRGHLPRMCKNENLKVSELTFLDYRQLVQTWLEMNPF